jgi:AAA domain
VEGPAGAGKTTTLAAAREALATREGHRLLVLTPTLKAARAATSEVGTRAASAAWLAWQHGWRWDQTGAWTRTPTVPTREAVLRRGDLPLVDEVQSLGTYWARTAGGGRWSPDVAGHGRARAGGPDRGSELWVQCWSGGGGRCWVRTNVG